MNPRNYRPSEELRLTKRKDYDVPRGDKVPRNYCAHVRLSTKKINRAAMKWKFEDGVLKLVLRKHP
uniref:Uncharacterized protein n=1 Tax=Rhizophora mucronata TaxID=61149 RepID=A0A2P2P9T7_RHIMU